MNFKPNVTEAKALELFRQLSKEDKAAVLEKLKALCSKN